MATVEQKLKKEYLSEKEELKFLKNYIFVFLMISLFILIIPLWRIKLGISENLFFYISFFSFDVGIFFGFQMVKSFHKMSEAKRDFLHLGGTLKELDPEKYSEE